MKLGKIAGVLFAIACFQGIMAQPKLDTLWACRDSIIAGSPDNLYFQMFLSDTNPDNRGQFGQVDTGDKCDGSEYINFDYKFSLDSVFLKQAVGDTIYHCAPRPGFAGFKIYWDDGYVKFFAENYDSMFLWHKGPLSGHKVKLVWAQGGDCGGPVNYQDFAEFKSSSTWKRECFGFPAGFERHGLFELRVLIYNDNAADTPLTSAKGCLKLDNIGIIKSSLSVAGYLNNAPKLGTGSNVFTPKVSGRVALAIFSMKGEQLYNELVDVEAGKRYNVRQFARKSSNLPSAWIQCVQITGAGVNIAAHYYR